MLKVFKNFFDFCGGGNKKKFILSIVLGVLFAFAEALRIPAVFVMMRGLIAGNVTRTEIWLSLGIMLFSISFLNSLPILCEVQLAK